jgi:putative ABC transport system ATP-binding protein
MDRPPYPGSDASPFESTNVGIGGGEIYGSKDVAFEALKRVAFALHSPVDRSLVDFSVAVDVCTDMPHADLLIVAARQIGIFVKETDLEAPDALAALQERYPVIVGTLSGALWVCESAVDRQVSATRIAERVVPCQLSYRQLKELLAERDTRTFVAKRELECDTASSFDGHHGAASHGGHHGHGADHLSPQLRFFRLLSLEWRDVATIIMFALVAGVLGLATPLAVEALVNVVNWGTFVQPLLVLAGMLLACLGIAGILEVLQSVVVELIQRRQFVRIVSDLSHRFTRANQPHMEEHYPRELANRFFDIMTIQKSTATLLLDGISIVMATFLGMGLLAVYHPYLLAFNVVLLVCMAIIVFVLGRGGVRTSIEESIVKYEVAHWLQDVIAMPSVFKINGGESLAVDRANRLMTEYIAARERQFRILLRQISFAVGLQVIASTVLLGLGGWLVVMQELSPGQLVASELVITLIVGAFAKAGKSLEKFYDLMAGVDKVGHMLDVPVDIRLKPGVIESGPTDVRWGQLSFHEHETGRHYHVPANEVAPGSTAALIADHHGVNSMLIKSIAGLAEPEGGLVEIGGMEVLRAAYGGNGRIVGYAGELEIFHGTIQENVDLGRTEVGHQRLRDVLTRVNLWDDVIAMPDGVRTRVHTDGLPLSIIQRKKLVLARAMAGGPRLLLINGLLDGVNEETRQQLWNAINYEGKPWTVLLSTNEVRNAELCDQVIHLAGKHA